MSLLITLAIIGGLVALYALVCGGVYISVYVVGLIKTFKERTDNFVEDLKERRKNKLAAKAEKKALKTEIVESKESIKEEINELTEKSEN